MVNCKSCGKLYSPFFARNRESGLCDKCYLRTLEEKRRSENAALLGSSKHDGISVPIVHIFQYKREEGGFQTIHKYNYKEAVINLKPRPGTTTLQSYHTTVRCPICQDDVPIHVGQATVIPFARSELSLHDGEFNLLRIYLLAVSSGIRLKLIVAAIISVAISLFLSVFSKAPFFNDFIQCTAGLIVIFAIIDCLVTFVHLSVSQHILLAFRSGMNLDHVEQRCFNLLTFVTYEGKDGMHRAEPTHIGGLDCPEESISGWYNETLKTMTIGFGKSSYEALIAMLDSR